MESEEIDFKGMLKGNPLLKQPGNLKDIQKLRDDYKGKDAIPRKLAAIEVRSAMQTQVYICFGALAALVIVAVLAIVSVLGESWYEHYGLSVVGTLFSVVFGGTALKAYRRMKYLDATYFEK